MYCKPARFALSGLFVALTAFTGGCGKKAAGPAPRYAVVRFENLTGDVALEWTARAASDLLSQSLARALDGPLLARPAVSRLGLSLGARPSAVPGISTELAAAQAAGATHVITGYIEKTAAGLRISGAERDLASGTTVRSVVAMAPDPLNAMDRLAKAFSDKAAPSGIRNEQALRLYFTSRETDTQSAVSALEQAVTAEPDFGDAWVALAEGQRALGDNAAAAKTIATARLRKLDDLNLAYLDFLSDALNGDQGPGRLEAMKRISELSPGDTVLLRSLAQGETAEGRFEAAAASWKKLTEVLPDDADARNQLGYTLAWNGNYQGAVEAMKTYGLLRPAEPNPLDSLGDIHFMYRKFPEAAAAYLQASAKAPAFQGGGDLYKAAWAKFRAGDKPGADALFEQFRKAREKGGGFALLAADWLCRTGRRKEAAAELRAALDAANPAEKPAIYDELAIFDLLSGDRIAAAKDAAAAGPPTTPGSFIVRFCTLPSASAAEWVTRADRTLPDPKAAPVRALAVGYALLLDGKRQEALPVWKELSEKSRGNDFSIREIYPRLRGEQPKITQPPDPASVNPFAPVLDPS